MKILVVKLSSFGDILHVLPTVQALKEQTGASVDWVVHPEFASLVRCFADVDRVLTFPRRHLWKEARGSIARLRETEYDLVVDLHGLFKSGVVARFARARRRIAPSYAREGSALFFGERAGRMNRTRHAVEQAFDTLDYLGLKRPDGVFRARLRPVAVELPAASPLIAFAPVSRWVTKNWPASRFAEVAKAFAASHPGAAILVLGGKGDSAVGEEIASAAPGLVRNLCGKTTIPESLEILSRCDLLIANDTGPVHMAAAVGTRCLVVFGPTRPDWTGPYGPGHRVIMRKLPCQPCLKRQCKRGDLACLMEIAADEVHRAACEMLASGADVSPASF